MRFGCPGCTGVDGVSCVVSSRRAGESVVAERISISVPVLDSLMSTALILAGSDNCHINPTPRLKFGNGTASWYVSVDHAVDGSPSIARSALPGLSAPGPGGKTVARMGFTVPVSGAAP